MENLIKTFANGDLKGFRWMVNPLYYEVKDGALLSLRKITPTFFIAPWSPANVLTALSL